METEGWPTKPSFETESCELSPFDTEIFEPKRANDPFRYGNLWTESCELSLSIWKSLNRIVRPIDFDTEIFEPNRANYPFRYGNLW